jgi:hypothetical protein
LGKSFLSINDLSFIRKGNVSAGICMRECTTRCLHCDIHDALIYQLSIYCSLKGGLAVSKRAPRRIHLHSVFSAVSANCLIESLRLICPPGAISHMTTPPAGEVRYAEALPSVESGWGPLGVSGSGSRIRRTSRRVRSRSLRGCVPLPEIMNDQGGMGVSLCSLQQSCMASHGSAPILETLPLMGLKEDSSKGEILSYQWGAWGCMGQL